MIVCLAGKSQIDGGDRYPIRKTRNFLPWNVFTKGPIWQYSIPLYISLACTEITENGTKNKKKNQESQINSFSCLIFGFESRTEVLPLWGPASILTPKF